MAQKPTTTPERLSPRSLRVKAITDLFGQNVPFGTSKSGNTGKLRDDLPYC
jgi:hypothetical protein